MRKLPNDTLEILKICSCIGSNFNLDLLSHISELTVDECFDLLKNALFDGMIIQYENIWQFVHDKIREAIYTLISKNEQTKLHYRIGITLLSNFNSNDKDEKIFNIVYQLNSAKKLLKINEREQLFEINIKAATIAKESNAFSAASKFYNDCSDLINKDFWEIDYNKCLHFYTSWAEIEMLATNYDKANSLIIETLNNAQTLMDKVPIYALRIDYYMYLLDFKKAISFAKYYLKELGLILPEESPLSQNAIGPEYEKSIKLLNNREPEQLLYLSDITDETILAQLNIMAKALPPSIRCDFFLNSYLSIKMINIFLQKGNTPTAVTVYQTYGYLLLSLNEYELGYKFGEISLKLADKYDIKGLKAIASFLFGMVFDHLKNNFSNSISYLNSSIELCKESGNLEYLGNNFWARAYLIFLTGQNLKRILEESFNKYRKDRIKLKQEQTDQLVFSWRDLIEKLLGFIEIDDKESQHQNIMILEKLKSAENNFGLAVYYISKPILFFILDKFNESLSAILEIEKNNYLSFLPGNPPTCVYHFYRALTLITLFSEASKNEQEKYIEMIIDSLNLFETLNFLGPNYYNKYNLIIAECLKMSDIHINIQNLLKKFSLNNPTIGISQNLASIYYEKAITAAKENGFTHEEAIANECAAKYYLSMGAKTAASAYMTQARYCYEKWGCKPKVEMLEMKYPELLTEVNISLSNNKVSTSISSNSENKSDSFIDLDTVLKSSYLLSSEMDMSALLEKMTKILIENAGAQKGILIIPDDKGELLIEAERELAGNKIKVLQSQKIEESNSLSAAIVHYVAKSKEIIVLDDATNNTAYAGDVYIKNNNPLSILCAPIINQNKLTAVLYLENNLSTGVFTRQRVDMLKFLSTQAAISIENARVIAENKKLFLKQQVDKEQIEKSLHEKEILLKELFHRTKNNLHVMISMLNLQSRYSGSNETKTILKEASGKLEAMALIHNRLYSSQNLSNIPSLAFIEDLVSLIKRSFSMPEVKIKTDMDDFSLLIDIAIPLGLVINELLTNAFKYAFPEKTGKIEISFKKKSDKLIKLVVKDNGIGFNSDFNIDQQKTLGLFIIMSIIKDQLEGSIEFKSENGVKCTILIESDIYQKRL